MLALRVAAVAVAAWLLARTFAGVDWSATWRVLASAGPAALLALLPFAVALVLDTTGMLLVARGAGVGINAMGALAARVVSEAFHFGAPGGVVASEAAALGLLGRCGAATNEAPVLVAGRKWLVMRSHAIYLVLGALASASMLTIIGNKLGLHLPLGRLVALSALVPLACSVALRLAMRRGLPRLMNAGPCVERLVAAKHLTTSATIVFLAAWLVESAETALLLRLAGAPLSMASVLAIETGLSLARSAVAFAPGGLGVQDIGYATALSALGVPHEHAAAFVILKRAKEVAWIAIGFLVFGHIARSSASSSATSASPKYQPSSLRTPR